MFVAAGALTAVMAWPVVRQPSEFTVGNEIAGRYRDPFVVMRQYDAGVVPPPFLQPATDLPGLALTRRVGGTAAYNILDLLSFPLAAVTAYLLTWKLSGSRLASAVAAVAFAWSPFHVAQASYHLHVAQVQWLPLLLLAAWTFAARPSAPRLIAMGAAAALLATASFYWGLIAAVILPVALVSGAVNAGDDRPRGRRVAISLAVAVLAIAMTIAGVITARVLLPGDLDQHAAAAGEAAVYAARGWHYLMPPIDHPWLDSWVRARFAADAAGWTLLEHQVGPGWSVLVLAIAGTAIGLGHAPWRGPVLWLLTLALAAFICSLAPAAAAIATAAPMFRAFARFAGVVALCAAVLAGVGARGLWTVRRHRWAAVLLLLLALLELRPAATRARDTLPTEGYRWLASSGGAWRVLDCASPGREYGASVAAVVGSHAGFREPPFDDCAEPEVAAKAAFHRYTHLLVRRNSREGRWLAHGGEHRGLRRVAETRDDLVLAVTSEPARVYVSGTRGLYDREFDGGRTWRWMPREAEWLVTNPASSPVSVVLEIKGDALAGPRDLEASIDGVQVARDSVAGDGWHRLGPLTLPPGESAIALRVPQGDVPADEVFKNGDPRPLAIRLDDWRWLLPAAGPSR